MPEEEVKVSLVTLGNGAASELFQMELQKVLDDIVNPNTKATAVRTVNLKVRVKPSEDRDYGEVSITCTSVLAPTLQYNTNFFIGRQRGRAVAREHNPKQAKLFDDDGLKAVPNAAEGAAE